MPWYRVKLQGNLESAAEGLRGSNVVYAVEEAFANFVDAGPPRLTALHAIVEANTTAGAEGRIRDALYRRGEVDLETAELSSRPGRFQAAGREASNPA